MKKVLNNLFFITAMPALIFISFVAIMEMIEDGAELRTIGVSDIIIFVRTRLIKWLVLSTCVFWFLTVFTYI